MSMTLTKQDKQWIFKSGDKVIYIATTKADKEYYIRRLTRNGYELIDRT